MIRIIYTAIYYFIMPFILIRLLWRSRKMADYRKRWNERFGYITPVTGKDSIWVHAVSVGETIAAIPLIKALHEKYSQGYHIVLTTTTPTGSSLVTQHLKEIVTHVYAPFDVPFSMRRFLRRSRVRYCIIMETELWPNLFALCSKQHIPIILANGRLSERSCLRYQFIPKLTKRMLNHCHTIITQGVLDGERYLRLGLDPKKLVVSGNIKFDLHIPEPLIMEGKALRAQIGKRPVFIAASTHDGEEIILIDALQRIRKKIPDLFLILAPRYIDHLSKILEYCHQARFKTQRRSENGAITSSTDILIVNTIGELRMIYAAADIAFVGGSLMPIGGHNLIEPAVLGLPILTGPNLQNFTEIAKLLQNAGAAQIVHNAQGICDTVVALCAATALREKIGKCARDTIEANRGALKKHLECIAECIPACARTEKTFSSGDTTLLK